MESMYRLCSIQGNTALVYTGDDSFDSVQTYFSQFGPCRINTQDDVLNYITYDNSQHLKQAKLALLELNLKRNQHLIRQ